MRHNCLSAASSTSVLRPPDSPHAVIRVFQQKKKKKMEESSSFRVHESGSWDRFGNQRQMDAPIKLLFGTCVNSWLLAEASDFFLWNRCELYLLFFLGWDDAPDVAQSGRNFAASRPRRLRRLILAPRCKRCSTAWLIGRCRVEFSEASP